MVIRRCKKAEETEAYSFIKNTVLGSLANFFLATGKRKMKSSTERDESEDVAKKIKTDSGALGMGLKK